MRKHIGYYLCQIGVITILLILISQMHENHFVQILLVISLGLFYAVWGILHHVIHHDLQLKIILEYSTIALLGISIIFLVMKGIL
jgi:hypothetical protein